MLTFIVSEMPSSGGGSGGGGGPEPKTGVAPQMTAVSAMKNQNRLFLNFMGISPRTRAIYGDFITRFTAGIGLGGGPPRS